VVGVCILGRRRRRRHRDRPWSDKLA